MSAQDSRKLSDCKQSLEAGKKSRKSEVSNSSVKVCHSYNTRLACSVPEIACEQCRSNAEYIAVVQHALKEVIEQNDTLRSRVAELEAVVSQYEDESQEKTRAIFQLEHTIAQMLGSDANKRKH